MSLHHKPIKNFYLDGIIKDESHIPRLKEEYLRLLVMEMRETGYAPRIDIAPDFTLKYDSEKNYFEFALTAYGMYIGRKKIEWIIAVDGYRPIHIQKTKLKESLSARAYP